MKRFVPAMLAPVDDAALLFAPPDQGRGGRSAVPLARPERC
jgi:hypothetical protein